MPRNITGKGGEFDSRPNPFVSVQKVGAAPLLSEVDGAARVLDSVIKSGSAVMLGQTRDGGAVCITILDGADRHRTYCSNDRELEQAFKSIAAGYSAG